MYHTLFQQKSEDWKITGQAPFIKTGDTIVFPDMSFTHKESGKTIHMELFHRWHGTQLEQRLDWLETHPENQLVLGVDRRLAPKESPMAGRLEESPYFASHGFLFRDFPGVARTTTVLDRVLKGTSS